jgi:putative ABC transport system substrate-binding protein
MGPFLTNQTAQIVSLAAPGSANDLRVEGVCDAGGLMSYATSLVDAYRFVGRYTGLILKGANSEELPVQQVMKIELLVNLKTATALGLTIPPSIMVRADEVIE